MPTGSYESPYTWSQFLEIRAQGNWRGGHVRSDGGSVLYYNGNGDQSCDHCDMCVACGCCNGHDQGCGCGCGEGCGCGSNRLVAGRGHFHPNIAQVSISFEVSWSDGSFQEGTRPSLHVELEYGSGVNVTNLRCEWGVPFLVKILFTINAQNFSFEYPVPESYRR